MRSAILGAVVVCAMVAAAAFPEDHGGVGLYIGASGGVLLADEMVQSKVLKDGDVLEDESRYDAYEAGYGLSGALGYEVGGGVRAEVEFSYQATALSSWMYSRVTDLKTSPRIAFTSFMVNGLYDLDTGSPIRPFLGLGIGAAYSVLTVDALKEDAEDSSPPKGDYSGWGTAYQFQGGIAYDISDEFSIRVGYRGFLPYYSLLVGEEEKLENDDYLREEYGADAVINVLPWVFPLVHRIELGLTYRLPF